MDGPSRLKMRTAGVSPAAGIGCNEAFRALEAFEDALLTMEEASVSPGLQDELATVIRLLHVRLGLDEGGVG